MRCGPHRPGPSTARQTNHSTLVIFDFAAAERIRQTASDCLEATQSKRRATYRPSHSELISQTLL